MDQRHTLSGWHRSTRCSTGGCIEMTQANQAVLIRDSKATGGAILEFSPSAWSNFVSAAIKSEFRAS
jgi:hypothetical protein